MNRKQYENLTVTDNSYDVILTIDGHEFRCDNQFMLNDIRTQITKVITNHQKRYAATQRSASG